MHDIKQHGQALVTLLFFIIIGISITTAAAIVILTSSDTASSFELGTNAYYIAESGVENALLQLERNPSYTGEVLPVGSGTATVTVATGSSMIITSVGNLGNYLRKIQVQAVYNNNILSVTSWKEIN